jgi:hypothetical protein
VRRVCDPIADAEAHIRAKVKMVAAEETTFGVLTTGERITVALVLERYDLGDTPPTPSSRNASPLDHQTTQYLGAINPENSVFKPTNFNGFHAAANNGPPIKNNRLLCCLPPSLVGGFG